VNGAAKITKRYHPGTFEWRVRHIVMNLSRAAHLVNKRNLHQEKGQ